MGFTALQLSYTAWGAELAGNYRERSRIAGFREAFTLVGTLIAIDKVVIVTADEHVSAVTA